MKVGFYTVYRKDPQHYILAAQLIKSVRETMPGVEIVHLTDETSPAVHGADKIVRLPNGKMLERRLEHYASCGGEWLLLDTDVLVKTDVQGVFAEEFDVALTDRYWAHLPQSSDVWASMPFNTGVVFTRSMPFWKAVLDDWCSVGENDWL